MVSKAQSFRNRPPEPGSIPNRPGFTTPIDDWDPRRSFPGKCHQSGPLLFPTGSTVLGPHFRSDAASQNVRYRREHLGQRPGLHNVRLRNRWKRLYHIAYAKGTVADVGPLASVHFRGRCGTAYCYCSATILSIERADELVSAAAAVPAARDLREAPLRAGCRSSPGNALRPRREWDPSPIFTTVVEAFP
ncbi:hypothetical protein HPB50_013082 [Hyalomma asiaticum]|uniref:Uncharacterized protein n=1 Tax=Hyalomma asiaticum TaxID=266040 RepID=A0ACB7RQR4_HYAAI|nr:hypothetical protein HPB50_013082 [Hyalomma asiaticum]